MKILRSAVALSVLLAATSIVAPKFAFADDPAGGVVAMQAAAAGQEAKPDSVAPALVPQIDDAAMALLQKSQAALQRLKTYRAEAEITIKSEPGADGKLRAPSRTLTTMTASKPNRIRFESYAMTADASGALTIKPDVPDVLIASDGKNVVMQSGKTYKTTPLKSVDQLPSADETSDGFYRPEASLYSRVERSTKAGEIVVVRSMGSEAVNGIDCQKVFVDTKLKGPNDLELKETYYFGPDNLVRRTTAVVTSKQGNYTNERTVTRLKTNERFADSATLFAYTPPAGITLTPKPPPPLLANGVAAPDFTAVDSTGATVKLSDFRGKVVVVDFWASWCPPCKASMPHNQEVIKKLQAAGVPVVLLAVDNSERGTDANKRHAVYVAWVTSHPEFDALKFVYVDQKVTAVGQEGFHVTFIPTQYVIDPQGVVRASSVGYSGPTDELENAVHAAAEPMKVASK